MARKKDLQSTSRPWRLTRSVDRLLEIEAWFESQFLQKLTGDANAEQSLRRQVTELQRAWRSADWGRVVKTARGLAQLEGSAECPRSLIESERSFYIDALALLDGWLENAPSRPKTAVEYRCGAGIFTAFLAHFWGVDAMGVDVASALEGARRREQPGRYLSLEEAPGIADTELLLVREYPRFPQEDWSDLQTLASRYAGPGRWAFLIAGVNVFEDLVKGFPRMSAVFTDQIGGRLFDHASTGVWDARAVALLGSPESGVQGLRPHPHGTDFPVGFPQYANSPSTTPQRASQAWYRASVNAADPQVHRQLEALELLNGDLQGQFVGADFGFRVSSTGRAVLTGWGPFGGPKDVAEIDAVGLRLRETDGDWQALQDFDALYEASFALVLEHFADPIAPFGDAPYGHPTWGRR